MRVGNLPRRSRSAPRLPHAGRSCPPAPRCRAGAAGHPALVCNAGATAAPGRLLDECGCEDRRACARDPRRIPAMSCRRHQAPHPALARSRRCEEARHRHGEERGEPFLPIQPCSCPYTVQSRGHAYPARSPARVGSSRVLLGPSLGSAGSDLGCPTPFAGFPATMEGSDFSRPCIIGFGSSPSRCGPGRDRSGQT